MHRYRKPMTLLIAKTNKTNKGGLVDRITASSFLSRISFEVATTKYADQDSSRVTLDFLLCWRFYYNQILKFLDYQIGQMGDTNHKSTELSAIFSTSCLKSVSHLLKQSTG